jgi:hypothetical protein
MLTQVHDIGVTLTRTPLEAALLENEDIKALQPPYNVQLVGGDPRMWFSTTQFDAASTHPDETHRLGPLPSMFSVRALGAIIALASGERDTRSLRSRAVGASERFGPDEAVFAAGFARFAERHLPAQNGAASVRRSLVNAAKQLILATKSDMTSNTDAELGDETNGGAGEFLAWDPERVVRHLERAVAQSYQLLQRARWLCLLYDSAVVFQEPPSHRPRLLLVSGGLVAPARDLLPDEPIPGPVAYLPLRERPAAFDRSCYDRLRTLTSELKRVLRNDGAVAVRVGPGRWLRESTLCALLLSV